MSRIRNVAIATGLALAVAACGDGNNRGASAPPPPVVMVPPPPPEDGFGARFGAAFRADANSAPIVPADGDIVPLSLTTDAIPVG